MNSHQRWNIAQVGRILMRMENRNSLLMVLLKWSISIEHNVKTRCCIKSLEEFVQNFCTVICYFLVRRVSNDYQQRWWVEYISCDGCVIIGISSWCCSLLDDIIYGDLFVGNGCKSDEWNRGHQWPQCIERTHSKLLFLFTLWYTYQFYRVNSNKSLFWMGLESYHCYQIPRGGRRLKPYSFIIK